MGSGIRGVVRTAKNSAVFCVVLIEDKLDKMFEHSHQFPLSPVYFCSVLKEPQETRPLSLFSM